MKRAEDLFGLKGAIYFVPIRTIAAIDTLLLYRWRYPLDEIMSLLEIGRFESFRHCARNVRFIGQLTRHAKSRNHRLRNQFGWLKVGLKALKDNYSKFYMLTYACTSSGEDAEFAELEPYFDSCQLGNEILTVPPEFSKRAQESFMRQSDIITSSGHNKHSKKQTFWGNGGTQEYFPITPLGDHRRYELRAALNDYCKRCLGGQTEKLEERIANAFFQELSCLSTSSGTAEKEKMTCADAGYATLFTLAWKIS